MISERPARVVHGADGLNSAGHPADLAGSLETPLAHFFTRSHASPPAIDLAAWRLQVDGLVGTPLSLSFDELQRFAMRDVPATLLCAGLRRDELLRVAPLPGELPWGPEAASTGRWTGVSLADVLDEAGLSTDARHIEFTALDSVERGGARFGFGGSITAEKARERDVLIAFAMNGAPLALAHGFPARTIVPGWIGARSVKWLGRITAAVQPSLNYFHTHAYRMQRSPDPLRPLDVSTGVALSNVFLNAVILDPAPAQRVPTHTFTARGWAMGAGGAPVTGIEFSTDGGATWNAAELDPLRARWTWTRWSAAVTLPAGRHVLVVRAHDTTGVAQPEHARDAWNVKGYANNAWHRVEVIASQD
jgi:sulfite oxidase